MYRSSQHMNFFIKSTIKKVCLVHEHSLAIHEVTAEAAAAAN